GASRPAGDFVGHAEVPALHRRGGGEGDVEDAGDGGDAVADAVHEGGLAGTVGVALHGAGELEGEDAVGADAEIGGIGALEAADEDAGGGDEDEGEGDLGDDEAVAQAPGAAGGAALAFAETVGDVAAGGGEG